MDLRKVKSLIDLVSESDISELEISEGQDKVKIVKSPRVAKEPSFGKDLSYGNLSRQRVQDNSEILNEKANIIDEASADDSSVIVSPMVGTFYRAPSPNSKPFVTIGEEIKEGQTLCVIEAMKLMNEIPSDKNGIIREILVENGQPVEYGQILFRID